LNEQIVTRQILIICPYPLGSAPSQRFRFEQYLDLLASQKYDVKVKPFLSRDQYSRFYQRGNFFSKLLSVSIGLIKRIELLNDLRNCDFVFIHREAAPIGPPIIEWMVAKVLKKKVIYDFDDAIWLTDKLEESSIERLLRWRSKIEQICRWSYKISCGNKYLADFAQKFNSRVVVNPSTIDVCRVHNPEFFQRQDKNTFTIGWTGSHSTLKYLESMQAVFEVLELRHNHMRLLVVSDQPPKLLLKNLMFLPWSRVTEIANLVEMDVGIMPLPNDAWTKGKGGFKALQYMAMGIPALVSPVGINVEIVEDGKNGFWCSTDQDWIRSIELLMQNDMLRRQMGREARKKIVDQYSVDSNASNFLSLFQ
jgi:glycosyltransferase involved in cell wall biosynthesis